MKELYSIDLCFGKQDHLSIKGPILIPYLEQEEEINDPNFNPNQEIPIDIRSEESSKYSL